MNFQLTNDQVQLLITATLINLFDQEITLYYFGEVEGLGFVVEANFGHEDNAQFFPFDRNLNPLGADYSNPEQPGVYFDSAAKAIEVIKATKNA